MQFLKENLVIGILKTIFNVHLCSSQKKNLLVDCIFVFQIQFGPRYVPILLNKWNFVGYYLWKGTTGSRTKTRDFQLIIYCMCRVWEFKTLQMFLVLLNYWKRQKEIILYNVFLNFLSLNTLQETKFVFFGFLFWIIQFLSHGLSPGFKLFFFDYSQFWRTKVLTLAPRFIVVNKLNKTILIRQSNTNSAFSLLPNERAPFHWVNGNLSEKTLQIRIDTGNCPWYIDYSHASLICWTHRKYRKVWPLFFLFLLDNFRSGAFKLTEMEFFPLQILDKNTQEPYFVRVRTKLDHGIVTVLFTEESDNQNPLFKIENHLDVDVSVWQKVHCQFLFNRNILSSSVFFFHFFFLFHFFYPEIDKD